MDPFIWFNALPPITRSWFGISLACTVAVTLDLVPRHRLIFDWDRITTPHLELWRLVTSFCYGGGTLKDFHTLFSLYSITVYGRGYEMRPLNAGGGSRTADAAFSVLFCAVVVLATYPLINLFVYMVPLFTSTLTHAVMYLWSRQNPRARIDLNFIPMEGRYVPFASVGIALCLGNRIHESIQGMAIGHVYYYLVEVVPKVFGTRVLTTPRLLTELLGEGDHVMAAAAAGGEGGYDSDEDVGLPPLGPNDGAAAAARGGVVQDEDDGATAAHLAAKAGNIQFLRDIAALAEEEEEDDDDDDDDEDDGSADRDDAHARGPASFHAKDRNGWQPIHEAARGGHLEVVNFLAAYGVDLSGRPNDGRGPTPLWWAETTHGPDHPVSVRLRELGAVSIGFDGDDR